MNLRPKCRPSVRRITLLLLGISLPWAAAAQDRGPAPGKTAPQTSKPQSKPTDTQMVPAQIELLETRVRFETDGSSRKEVHAVVKIKDELGVRQFARLRFGYNRAFQQLQIPLVHIVHQNGGTADILPGAITDAPVDAVAGAPAFGNVRAKSVRILGLAPGDTLEYRVITLTGNAPLAPEFSLRHRFSSGGVVTREVFEVGLPGDSHAQFRASPGLPKPETLSSVEGATPRKTLRWVVEQGPGQHASGENALVDIGDYPSWRALSAQLGEKLAPPAVAGTAVEEKVAELTRGMPTPLSKLEALYDFVSAKIRTVDLPLGETGFAARSPSEVLSSGYGTAEEKVRLLASLAARVGIGSQPVLTGRREPAEEELPSPQDFSGIFLRAELDGKTYWLDPGLEVLPFDMVPAELRGQPGFLLTNGNAPAQTSLWTPLPNDLPFAAKQDVRVGASLAANGELQAKVKYTLRGDNELLLRVAFHHSAREKWKELAQLLSLSDGFRGQVTSVSASDPLDTREPFTVEYEITQAKLVDWSRKSIRMPALLPQLGLPDPPAKAAPGEAEAPVDLGTPLDIHTSMTLRLPPGTRIIRPPGTSVERDYATYASDYGSSPARSPAEGPEVTASRRLNFLLRQVSAGRHADYNAFLHAVQNDETQEFVLERETKPPASPKAGTATAARLAKSGR